MASTGSGIVAPQDFPIRDPKDPKQKHGRMVNPPRYADKMGGLTSGSKWPGGNSMKVEKPTGVRGAHSVSE